MISIAVAMLLGQASVGDDACASQANILDIDQRPARQGATLKLRPRRYYDMAERDLAERCIVRWEVSDPKVLALAADHRSLTISADASSGATVTVGYFTAGSWHRVSLKIVGKDEPDLTGVRTQTAIAWCGGEPLGELKFTSAGRFTATVHPFESYIDHGGTYTWDPASNALTLMVEDGGSTTTLRGKAKFDALGNLHIDGIALDRMAAKPGCQNTFR